MFTQILIPLDGSSLAECVIPHAVALASANHPQIHLLRVIDPTSQETRPRTIDPFDWNFRKIEAEAYLNKFSEQLAGSDLNVRCEVREGKAADTIVQYIHEKGIDLVSLSSHGRSGLTGWNVSSVVQKIILRARTSILLVRAYQVPPDQAEIRYKRILLPLDGSQRAESVLGIAMQLARHHTAEVIAVHVIQRPEMPRRKPLSPEDSSLADRIVEQNRAEAMQYLADIQSVHDIPVQTRLYVSANVAPTLHQVVEDEEIDLVALTAHGFTGNPAWLYGSIVNTFISYGTTPLLIYQDMMAEAIQPTKAEKIALNHGDR
jgi:nucleotide-binding universal stress UspA family protein